MHAFPVLIANSKVLPSRRKVSNSTASPTAPAASSLPRSPLAGLSSTYTMSLTIHTRMISITPSITRAATLYLQTTTRRAAVTMPWQSVRRLCPLLTAATRAYLHAKSRAAPLVAKIRTTTRSFVLNSPRLAARARRCTLGRLRRHSSRAPIFKTRARQCCTPPCHSEPLRRCRVLHRKACWPSGSILEPSRRLWQCPIADFEIAPALRSSSRRMRKMNCSGRGMQPYTQRAAATVQREDKQGWSTSRSCPPHQTRPLNANQSMKYVVPKRTSSLTLCAIHRSR